MNGKRKKQKKKNSSKRKIKTTGQEGLEKRLEEIT